jgi:hypothetical protein
MRSVLSDTSLSPAEKEDKEAERLIDKNPPPSRKHTERRGPKWDNRRRRMKVEDNDISPPSKGDKDISLNRKIEGFNSTSNGPRAVEAMVEKVSTYHGIIDQRGNPTDPPNTGYKSYHSRYFTEEHYKSIIKNAKALLEEDWLKYGWDGGAEDAKYRAALDLAIHMADSNLYQSKIDAETYDMLLNRLAGWGHDSFSETIIPMKIRKNASIAGRVRNYQDVIKIANEIRHDEPEVALVILKNLRSIISTDPDYIIAQEPGDIVEFQSMSDDDFKKLKEEAKREMNKLFGERDIEAFLEGIGKVVEKINKETKSKVGTKFVTKYLLNHIASNPEMKQLIDPVILKLNGTSISQKLEFDFGDFDW